MKARSTTQRVLLIVLATLLLVLSGTMAWAAVNDFAARGIVPRGVSLAGTDLSGMSEAEARRAIEQAVSAPVMRPIRVQADGKTFTFDPRDSVQVDVDGMIAAAYAPRRSATYLARVAHDVAKAPLSAEVEPSFTIDEAILTDWLESIADEVDRPAKDATLTIENSGVVIIPEKGGRKTDLEGAAAALAGAFESEAALASGDREVTIPVDKLKPKVTADSFGKTIVVDLSQRRVRLFDGAKLEVTYRCAIGTPSYPTPRGHFEIVQKRFMPTWVNPGSAWAKDMPRSIPPGPSNPLGTRALNLSASGIRFHGTNKIYSVGTAASHGCMRMLRRDIEDFYPRVEVGTQVYIVP